MLYRCFTEKTKISPDDGLIEKQLINNIKASKIQSYTPFKSKDAIIKGEVTLKVLGTKFRQNSS